MKFLIILAVISVILVFSTFFIEEKIISNLPETSRFKKWWRKSIVGDVNDIDHM
jgi:hypothetical protein